jgi:hypothetical protein
VPGAVGRNARAPIYGASNRPFKDNPQVLAVELYCGPNVVEPVRPADGHASDRGPGGAAVGGPGVAPAGRPAAVYVSPGRAEARAPRGRCPGARYTPLSPRRCPLPPPPTRPRTTPPTPCTAPRSTKHSRRRESDWGSMARSRPSRPLACWVTIWKPIFFCHPSCGILLEAHCPRSCSCFSEPPGWFCTRRSDTRMALA